jgi:hypothetical protein
MPNYIATTWKLHKIKYKYIKLDYTHNNQTVLGSQRQSYIEKLVTEPNLKQSSLPVPV